MGKYVLSVWPQSQYRCAIYDNVPRYKRAKDVLKANPGAKGAINLALFAMVNYPAQGIKVNDINLRRGNMTTVYVKPISA